MISDSIHAYTILKVLLKMRRELGLEAMLEYIEHYVYVVGKNNQSMNIAVTKCLNKIDAGKLYESIKK